MDLFLKFPCSFPAVAIASQQRGAISLPTVRKHCLGLNSFHSLQFPSPVINNFRRRKRRRLRASSNDSDDEEDGESVMTEEERREWRRKIREVIAKSPDVEEEVDPVEKKKRMQQLLANYPLVVDEDDPDWPEDADGWGFKLGQFFDKITIKNVRKDDDDENCDSENELVWQDDNYIRPIKDITTAEWEEAVFKDISPLIVLVHNRYKRPKENEKIRDELEKAVHIIWNCRLPSPRFVSIDAAVELDLLSAFQVSVFPEVFIKAGKILYREKDIWSAVKLSKRMAFFYYGAAKPPNLTSIDDRQEMIPSISTNNQQYQQSPISATYLDLCVNQHWLLKSYGDSGGSVTDGNQLQ